MHGLLVRLDIDAPRSDEAMDLLRRFVVPTITSGEGYVSGTWIRSLDGKRGQSLHLYESEEAAKAAADRAGQGPPPGAPITFVSAEVFEVVAQA